MDFADHLQYCFKNPDARPNASEYVKQKYSWENVYKALDEEFNLEKFVLEIPNFVPTNVCTSSPKGLKRIFEGSFTYPIGDQLITRKKNSTELRMFEDTMNLFVNYTHNVFCILPSEEHL